MRLASVLPGVQPADQPCASRFPVPLDRDSGNAKCLRNLVFLQPAEESQFDDASRAGIDPFEHCQRCVERDQILAACDYVPTVEVRERDPLLRASPLVGRPGARVVNQNPAHGLSRNGEKMRPILIGDGPVSEKTDAELVDQGVGFERMIPTFAPHEMDSYLPQLRLDDGKELVTRMRIALSPQTEPLRDLFVGCHRALGVKAMIQMVA